MNISTINLSTMGKVTKGQWFQDPDSGNCYQAVEVERDAYGDEVVIVTNKGGETLYYPVRRRTYVAPFKFATFPLSKARDIRKWFKNQDPYHDHRERFAIWFNVRLYKADLDVDHLWNDVFPTSDYADLYQDLTKDEVEHAFREAYAQLDGSELWGWAQESLYRTYLEDDVEHVGTTRLDGDYKEHRFELRGRSGGQLVLTAFDGYNFTAFPTKEEWDEFIDELAEPFLQRLYRQVRTWRHMFNPTVLCEEMEHEALYIVCSRMESICEDMLTDKEEAEALAEVKARVPDRDMMIERADNFNAIRAKVANGGGQFGQWGHALRSVNVLVITGTGKQYKLWRLSSAMPGVDWEESLETDSDNLEYLVAYASDLAETIV